MNKLRKLLDSLTMYRVVLYSLAFLVLISLVFSAFGWFSYSSPGVLALSLGLIAAVCYGTNQILSKLYGIASNFESSAITSMILYFVLGSPNKPVEWVGIGIAAAVAVASKYVVTWRGSHIFNPAAFGVLFVSLLGVGNGAWWIANEALFVPMLLVAFLVLLKVRRFEMFFAFALSALAFILYNSSGQPLSTSLWTAVTLYPILFLGSIMLTEPATMPNTRYMTFLFAVIVGVLFGSNLDIGFIGASPHLALLIGNLFAFVVASRSGAFLKLVEKTQLTPTTYEFAFEPSRKITHQAGQYMEFTLPDDNPDQRGNRRTFTVASSPQDALLRIGVKFYENGSKFKSHLSDLKIGDRIMGGHVGGDFTLPADPKTPVVLVAGGIGITPFIAIISDLIKRKETRTVDLYYFAVHESEIAYKDVLQTASKVGVTVHKRLGRDARLTAEDIQSHPGAHYYLSGPPGMVAAYKKQLRSSNVKKIHTDLFTGY